MGTADTGVGAAEVGRVDREEEGVHGRDHAGRVRDGRAKRRAEAGARDRDAMVGMLGVVD